jgi:hypothetical protein
LRRNFTIGQGVEIQCGSLVVDLHNCYDFAGFSFEAGTRSFDMNFQRNVHGEKLHSPEQVALCISGVTYLELSPNFVAEKNLGVEELGYKPSGDRDLDWLVREEKSAPDHQLILRFTNDEFIRVDGDVATVKMR